MILLDRWGIIVVFTLIFFLFLMLIKLFINVRSASLSLQGLLLFIKFSITYPFDISNEIYRKRTQLSRSIKKENRLDNSQKERLIKLVNSRPRLYYEFGIDHFLNYPKFIEQFTRSYHRVTKDKKSKPYSVLRLTALIKSAEELENSITGNFRDLFRTMTNRFS